MTKSLKLQELFDLASENAARMFNDHDDHEVLPMWHVVYGNGDNVLIATPWASDEEKDAVCAGLRKMFAAKQVKRYAFIVEAWVASVTTLNDATPPPSQHPDRREVLMITAEDRDGRQLMGWYFILRPEHGPPKLSPLETKPYSAHTGRMMGMLT